MGTQETAKVDWAQSPLYPRYYPQVLTPEDGNSLSRLRLEIPQSPCSRRNTHHFAAVAELLLIFIEKAEHNASEEPSFHSAPDTGCKSPVGGSETTEWKVPGKKKPEDASPVVPDCEDYD